MQIFEISLLLDFYGQLLTKRQFEIVDMYYNNDYSLGETAENLGISRQGVNDSIKKSIKLLNSYESKLGMVKRHLQEQQVLKDIDEALGRILGTKLESEAEQSLMLAKDKLKALFE